MTVPIVTVVRTDNALRNLSMDVRLAYCLPSHLQDQPPLPSDPEVTLETWPPMVLNSRSASTFSGLGLWSSARVLNPCI